MSRNHEIKRSFRPITSVTTETTVTSTGENTKTRFSKKYKCSKCGNKLEIIPFIDWNEKYVCDVYNCNRCLNFYRKEECE